MNSFNKTDAASFPMQAMHPGDFPFLRWMYCSKCSNEHPTCLSNDVVFNSDKNTIVF